MEAHLISALALSRSAFENADLDELLNDFLEFEAQACGPTVEEMFKALNMPTEQVLGLSSIDVSCSIDSVSCESAFSNVDATIDLHATINLNIEYLRELILQHSANDDSYPQSQSGTKISNSNESFYLGCDSNSDMDFALAA